MITGNKIAQKEILQKIKGQHKKTQGSNNVAIA
jgi:hypothetical protein